MRILAAIFLLLSASGHAAQGWISVEPNHLNLVYNAGESAEFFVRVLHEPTNPEYKLEVSVEHVGQVPASPLLLTEGVGSYVTPALPSGNSEFRFVARLVGPVDPENPLDPPFSQVVQDQVLEVRAF